MSGAGGSGGEPLYAVQRRERIMAELRLHGAVSVSALAVQLAVSELTIRRDVNALAQQGLVTRVHGGATLRSSLDPGARPAGPLPPRYTIGMVVPSLDYYWPPIVNGARAQAAQLRASLLLRASTYDQRDHRRQVEALLATPGLHGLIVAPDTTGDGALGMLRWLDSLPVPVVLAERAVPEAAATLRLDSVRSDHAAGAALAVHHLHQAGHRRIGLLVESGNPTAAPVRQGWRAALDALGLATDVALLEDIRFAAADRERALDEALDTVRRTATTAVIVLPDPQAIALQQHAIDRGVRVPDDLAIVAYDDDVARFGDPAITAVRPPKEHVGREAVNVLIARLEEGPDRPAYRATLGPELHARPSSSPAALPGAATDALPGESAAASGRGPAA